MDRSGYQVNMTENQNDNEKLHTNNINSPEGFQSDILSDKENKIQDIQHINSDQGKEFSYTFFKDKKIKKVLMISLYHYQLFSARVFHSIIEKYAEVKTVFFKKYHLTTTDVTIKPSNEEYDYLINLIKEFKPDMIGISVRSSYFPIAKEITKRIKEISNALIVWGGIHAIICPEECIKYADIVCTCEGETPIKNLFEKKNLDGFWVKYKGEIYKSPNRILTENLDELPTPDFGDKNKYYIEDNKITLGDPIKDCRIYIMMASRGCPFSCSYCINSMLKKLYPGKKIVRLRSVNSVMDELNAIRKVSKHLRRIFLTDEIFGVGNKEWMKEFVKIYKKEINLPFGMEYKPDLIKKDVMLLLKEAGLDNITMGLESGSERVRKEVFQRYITDEQMINGQKVLKEVGITGVYNIIVKNPLETVEDLKKGFELVMKFPRPFSFHIYRLINFPKTALTERLIYEKVISDSDFTTYDEKNKERNAFIFMPAKDNEEDFWINMISLSSKSFIPKKFLFFMSKKKYFIKHQAFVFYLTKVSNFIKLIEDWFRWASKEGFSIELLMQPLKNLKNYLKIYR